MTVKLAILKSGEDIVADIKEMVVGEGDDARVVGYVLTKPCGVSLNSKALKVDDEEAVGVDIMRRALDAPIRQICENAGVEPSIVAQAVREGKGDYGYDARTDEYVNMFKAGIIDPTKVARVAVENASSIAGTVSYTHLRAHET